MALPRLLYFNQIDDLLFRQNTWFSVFSPNLWGDLLSFAKFMRRFAVICRIYDAICCHLPPFGCPWAPWAPFGSSMFTVCDACAQNQASWNSSPMSRMWPKWCHPLLLRPPLPHALGARMTWVKTNSLKLYERTPWIWSLPLFLSGSSQEMAL